MSTSYNTSIIRNGLVFHMDASNTAKCWKGMPTTNLLTYSELPGSVYFLYSGSTIITNNAALSPTKTFTAARLTLTTGTSVWDMYRLVFLTAGNVYTYSAYVKLGTATNFCVVANNTSDWNINTSKVFTAQNGLNQSTYTRISMTFTAPASGRINLHLGQNQTTVLAATPQTAGTVFYWGEQIEQSSFATPYVATGSGTSSRATSQAFIDLTKNNTITATSLTYASDNTFSFNGSNYLQTGYSAALTDFTIGVWFKASGNTGGHDRIIDKLYTTGTMLMRNYNNANSWGGGVLESAPPYGRFLTLADGQWHYLVSVRQGTTHTLYGDGITNTISGTVSGTALNTNQFAVGSWYDNSNQRFNGSIPVVHIYNRALSATEVLQNYNALKDRYTSSIVTAGLIVSLDAANTASYPGTGSTWTDLSGYGNNATLASGATYSATPYSGVISTDATTLGYVDIPVSQIIGISTITVEGFFKWNSGNGTMFFGLSSFDIWTSGATMGFNNGVGNVIGISATNVTSLGLIGNIHHYAFVMVAGVSMLANCLIYIDGVLCPISVQVGSDGTSPAFSSVLKLASWNAGGFNGNMSYGTVRVYNRALSGVEVLQNFNAQRGRYGL